MSLSQFRLYSIAIAAENRKLDSHELECMPVEILGFVDGEITSDRQEFEDEGVDAFDESYTVKVSQSNSVVATWLQWGSNRITPPDIRRGERLMLWRFGDTDKLYWTDTGLDGFLRRLETAIWAFSNTRDESTKALTPENSYFMEVSTHRKQITLRTCKSDGEPFAYTMQLNTKEGVFTLTDDDENYIEFDSAERKITLKNKDGTVVILDKRNIFMVAPDLIKAVTKAIELHCKTLLVNAADSITMNTKQFTLNASTGVTIASPLLTGNIAASTFSGTVVIQGLATIMAGIAAPPGSGGSASLNIPLNVTGATSFTGTVVNNGINIGATHQHNETGMGGGTTTPPL